jgi:FkbM family methyltransferase
MGNTYTGGTYHDNERAKRHINKLLYGGKESLNYQKIKDKRLLLDVNQPNIKRIININTTTDFANAIDSKKEKFTFSYNSNKPSFITISDGKINPLSSYNIIYSNTPTHKRCYYIHDTSTRSAPFLPNVVYNSKNIKQLCNYLYNGEEITEDITLHNVGEYIYQSKLNNVFIPPNSNTPNYDDAYYFYIRSNDQWIQQDLEKGQPYEKFNMAYLSMFIPRGSTVIDVGVNIGTVSIPIARLHNSDVSVIAYELFNDTKKILDKNINENKAYNVISIESAVGDKVRPVVYIDLEHKDVNQGANKIGQKDSTNNASNTIHMTNIDSVPLDNISAIKVDVEGAEPLVFYGARDTITKFKPVIMFEKNEVVLDPRVQTELKISDEVFNFDIVDFCRNIGYTHFYKLSRYDFMLVHPNSFKHLSKEAGNKDIFRVSSIKSITRLDYDTKKDIAVFTDHEVRNYHKFEYIAPHKYKNVNAISLLESTRR